MEEGGRVVNNNNNNKMDDSLTSLRWLQEFSILGANVQQQAHQQPHLSGKQVGSYAPPSPFTSIGMPLTPDMPTAAAYSMIQSFHGIVAHGHCPDELDYKTNVHIKPPYTYTTHICMDGRSSTSGWTPSVIYKWTTDNFCYYRHAGPTFQHISHCVSMLFSRISVGLSSK
ncbi:hypothetical protein Q8A73_008500 [Channa argus]|nr:hypothetical protein Q8A73_008500 [Channa argus]